MKRMKLPHFILRGTYATMGATLGRVARNLIVPAVRYHINHLEHLGWRTKDLREQFALRYRSAFRQACRPEYDFLEGLAAGAGRSFLELFTVNIEEEFFSAKADDHTHCTALAFRDAKSGGAVIGHNEDWLMGDQRYQYIVTLMPDRGLRILSHTYGALLPVHGINSVGIASVNQSVYANDERVGIPRLPLAASLLRMRTLDAAIKQATRVGRAGGYHHLLGDASGRVVSLETSATSSAIVVDEKPKRFVLHTNHYCDPRMAIRTARRSVSSKKRLTRLATVTGKWRMVSVALLEAALSDHANAPRSICNHGDATSKEPTYDDQTLSSLILDPRHRTLSIRPGNPCTHAPQVFTLA